MSINLELPGVGSVVFTGYESNLQSNVIRDLAGQHLAGGGIVCALVDFSSEGRALENGITDWCRAAGVDLGLLRNFVFVDNVRQYHVAQDLQQQIKSRLRPLEDKPLLIVRDLGCATLQLLPGASWLGVADAIATLCDCLCITAGHHGPSGPPAPDLLKYRADATFVCKAGLNLALTINRVKPTDATVQLKGKVAPFGQIIFENVPQEGFSHVA